MLSLDASDPRLAFDFDESLDSVPLVSLLNYEPHLAEQVYEIDARRRSVSLVRTSDESISPLGSDLMLPVPLPEREIALRPMGPAEIPTDEAAFWEACDSFLGGSAFVRVGGAPIWLQEPRDPACDCGAPMRYVAAIGYEAYDRPSGIVAETIPFFVGEMAYYFFLRGPCSRLLVLSDPA